MARAVRACISLWGNGIPAKPGHAAQGDVQQVAATLLALAGLPPGRDVNGDPLDGATPTQRAARRLRGQLSAAAAPRPASARAPRIAMPSPTCDRSATSAPAKATPRRPAAAARRAPPARTTTKGVILKERGKLPQAIEAFEKALTVDPNLASAQWNLSDVLYAMGQNLDRSDALLMQARSPTACPTAASSSIGRAMAYQRVGNAARSLKLMDSAVARQRARSRAVAVPRPLPGRERRLPRGGVRLRSRAGARTRQCRRRMRRAASRACAPAIAPARARAFEQSLELDPQQPKLRDYITITGAVTV